MALDRSFYHVDSSEEIASVLRGIKKSQGNEVAVVLPPDPRLFRNDVNLRLLKIYAQEAGKNLALVSQDPGVVRLSSTVGIPIYASPTLAWKPEGRMESAEITEPVPVIAGSEPKRSSRRRRRPRLAQRLAAVLISILSVAALLVLLRDPVTIVVTPVTDALEQEVELSLVSPDSQEPLEAAVPVIGMEIPVEVADTRSATGNRRIGIEFAEGKVLFFNDGQTSVEVPAGTVISTDGGTKFATTSAVTVPARQVEYLMQIAVGMKAGQAEATVRAVNKGIAGNISAGRLTQLPKGPAGLQVLNPEPTYGGADRQEIFVSETDMQELERKLKSRLVSDGEALVQARLGAGILVDSVAVLPTEVTSFPSQPGTAGQELQMTVTGIAKARYVDEADVLASAIQLVQSETPANLKTLDQPAIEDLQLEEGRLRVSLKVPVQAELDPNAVLDMLIGKSLEEAEQLLVAAGNVASIEVRGEVGKRLPRWKPWIKVVVAEPMQKQQNVEASQP